MMSWQRQIPIRKNTVKKTGVNLHYIRNDFDLWHRTVNSWLDNEDKKNPSKDDLKTLGVTVVEKLVKWKILKKQDVLDIDFDEQHTPRRSCSAGRKQHNSPDNSANRSKSQTRLTRRDLHECDGIKVALQFNNLENENHAYIRKQPEDLVSQKIRTENEKLIKEIHEMRNKLAIHNPVRCDKEKQELKQKIDRMYKQQKSGTHNWVTQETHSMTARQMEDVYVKCENAKNLAVYENSILKKELQKVAVIHNENLKIRQLYKELMDDTAILKTKLSKAEADCKLMEKEKIAFKNTIENLEKHILEIQKRADEDAEDAKVAIVYYKEEENKYRKASKKAKAKLEDMQNDKEELQTMIQKLRSISSAEEQNHQKVIESSNKTAKELDKEKKKNAENTENFNKKIKKYEQQLKEFKMLRETADIKREEKNTYKLQTEIDELQHELSEVENKYAKEMSEHIGMVNQYKNSIEERDQARKIANKLQRDLTDALAKLKKQKAIFIDDKNVLENDIKDLRKQLSVEETNRWENARCMTEDFHKVQLDKKNEELVALTRTMYSIKEQLNLCEERKHTLEVQNEEQKRTIENTSHQYLLSEERSNSRSMKRLSDIEKENTSLKSELSVALKGLNKVSQEYKALEKRYDLDDRKNSDIIRNLKHEKDNFEIDNSTLKDQIQKLQEQWSSKKSEESLDHEFSRKETSSLHEQITQLEQDKEVSRQKIYSLEEEKIELNERLRKTELDVRSNQKYKTDSESLMRLYASLKSEFANLEAKLEAETKIRMDNDYTLENLKEENNRLRKDSNSVNTELQTVTRERNKLSQRLKAEANSGSAELDKLKKEKTDLIAVFKEQSKRDNEKIDKLEQESKNLLSRKFTSEEKANQQNAYELMQLRNDYEICKTQKIGLEENLSDVNQDVEELDRKLKESENHNREICEMYERENKKLKTQIQILEIKESTFKREVIRCKNCEEYEHKLSRAKTEFEALQLSTTSAAHKAGVKVKELCEKIAEERKTIEVIRGEMKTLENKKNEMESQLRLQNLSFGKENGEIINLRTENETLKQRLNSVIHSQEELERHKEELDKLKKRLLADEEKIMNSKEEKIGIQKENKKLKEDIQNLSIQVEKLESRLNIINDETSYVQQKNAELEKSLQEKVKQLKSSEARFRDLAGSIQNAEGLQNRIYTLEFEVSELNKRLSVLKDENLSLQKDNKDLKNKIEEKSRQLKTAEERLREYAVELEGIPSLKRRLQNLQTDNEELEKRCRQKDGLLQNADSNAQKMKKDNQQLQTQMISQKQNYDTLNNKLEFLKDKNIELEDRLRRRSPVVVAEPKNCQNCFKYRNDISDLKREINDLRDRLSEAAGNKLRDNNPNIADLSDMNRPTSLAEKFSSLYTDEYTDAMEVIEDDMDEAASVKVMLDWLKSCYDWCQRLAKEQRETLINRSIGFMQEHGGQKVVLSDRCLIFVKEFQKKIAVESLAVVGQICHVKSVTQQTLSSEKYIVKYIKKCSELCWMMQISDPPLYLNFDVNSGENLNKNDYNVFTKSGSKIDYLVWPVLYLHETGPMLAKGVAQGK